MTARHAMPADRLLQPFEGCTLLAIEEHLQRELSAKLQWQRLRVKLKLPSGETAGLAANILILQPDAFQPFPVQFHRDGSTRLLQDAALQKSIAHAYWQTCWAGGAIRVARGTSEPVAFIATDRSAGFQQKSAPAESAKLGNGHWIFGGENILLHRLQHFEKQPVFWESGTFTGAADPALLAWLGRKAFVDRFVAQNRSLPERFEIKRFVPVSGSHTISALLGGELGAFRDPHWSWNSSQVHAAVNGGFFLNFPEEYRNIWCAMNDPVGLLLLGGKIRQVPLAARSALLVSNTGKASIRTVALEDFALRLPWEKKWRRADTPNSSFFVDDAGLAGRETIVFTPVFHANRSVGQQKTPSAATVDFVVVFGEIVEARAGGGVEIPANGIVISCPIAMLPNEDVAELLQGHGDAVDFSLISEKFDAQAISTAVGAGPALLDRGKPIAADFFSHSPPAEQFLPARFVDGVAVKAGIAPTRFPHDAAITRAPRTILGITAANQLVLAVIDGRTQTHSLGATLQEAAGIAHALGCTQALNLDGGGSSVLMIEPHRAAGPSWLPEIAKGIVNIPSDAGHKDRLMPVPMLVVGDEKRRSKS